MNFYYQFDFAERLIEAADYLASNSSGKNEADRTILYLSRLSCEISLKALLERSGYTPKELKKFSHKLSELLKEVGLCKMVSTKRRASEIRAKVVKNNNETGTVGKILEAESDGGSIYPNEIRYGGNVKDYPANGVLDCAKVVRCWCITNKNNLTRQHQSCFGVSLNKNLFCKILR